MTISEHLEAMVREYKGMPVVREVEGQTVSLHNGAFTIATPDSIAPFVTIVKRERAIGFIWANRPDSTVKVEAPIKYTAKERKAITKWWADSFQAFRFLPNGTVEARRNTQSSWGLLYTAQQAKTHLDSVKKVR